MIFLKIKAYLCFGFLDTSKCYYGNINQFFLSQRYITGKQYKRLKEILKACIRIMIPFF